MALLLRQGFACQSEQGYSEPGHMGIYGTELDLAVQVTPAQKAVQPVLKVLALSALQINQYFAPKCSQCITRKLFARRNLRERIIDTPLERRLLKTRALHVDQLSCEAGNSSHQVVLHAYFSTQSVPLCLLNL